MKITLTLLFIASSVLFTAGASAETVYQWVDDEGVTQFGSQPPRGRDYRQIRTQTGHSEPIDYSSRYGQEENSNEGQDSERQSQEANTPTEAELDEACRTARQNLERLERGGRITVEDENGERRYLNEEEQAERAEQARRIQEQAC